MRLSYCPKCGYKKKPGQRPRTVHGATDVQVWGSHSAIFEICRECGFQFYVSYPMKDSVIPWEPARIVDKRVRENRKRKGRRRSILTRSRCPGY